MIAKKKRARKNPSKLRNKLSPSVIAVRNAKLLVRALRKCYDNLDDFAGATRILGSPKKDGRLIKGAKSLMDKVGEYGDQLVEECGLKSR